MMTGFLSTPCTAFVGPNRIARGLLADVALAVKAAATDPSDGPVLVFDDTTGTVIDLDLRGDAAEILARLKDRAGNADASRRTEADEPAQKARGRGRPKLGVVAREVTLLPRHWDWLASQPGGASQVLRRLVEQARRDDDGKGRARAAQDAAYRFMSTMAGDLPGFEEAARALFAGEADRLAELTSRWPEDVRVHVLLLAFP